MTAVTPPAPNTSIHREIASAYVASAARIISWVIVSAVVYRKMGANAFALLALVRGTIGILNYTSLGLAPAIIHSVSRINRSKVTSQVPAAHGAAPFLDYATPTEASPLAMIYSNAMKVAGGSYVVGGVLVLVYARAFDALFRIPAGMEDAATSVVVWMGLGVLFRVLGDAPGAVLQACGRITYDNSISAMGEMAWAVLVAGIALLSAKNLGPPAMLMCTAVSYGFCGGGTFAARWWAARAVTGKKSKPARLDWRIARGLLAFGLLVVVAQLADYLYAPTDYILINRLLPPVEVANYAPAVQIDAGLLLLVTGLASVLLPRTALAHASDDIAAVRRYFVRGTLASFVLLTTASGLIWAMSPWIFEFWLGNTMPATRAILPLMLVNTVIGGSSAVGRSILLGIGRVKPFTISVLIAGLTNVIVSWALVRYCGMGLRGIVLGTVVAVVGRCALWMPWYVMRSIRGTATPDQSVSSAVLIG